MGRSSPAGSALGLPVLLLVVALLPSCQSPPSASRAAAASATPGAASEPVLDPSLFSGDRAWDHMEALVDLGPRRSGSRGAERARVYLLEQLEALGLSASLRTAKAEHEGKDVGLVHVVTEIPGESSDTILLVTHYDTRKVEGIRFVGANDGASGPALLLEIARVLSLRRRPYTIEIAFLDGYGLLDSRSQPLGSATLAQQLADEGRLSRLRLAVFFDRVADADLAIGRDLGSHRVHREMFWDAARALGHADAFPREFGYSNPVAGQAVFVAMGQRRVVAIVDDRFGDALLGLGADDPHDDLAHCSPASLQVVGTVSVRALLGIEGRLEKIDRFARSPLDREQPPKGAPSIAVEPPAAGDSSPGPAGVDFRSLP